MYICVYIARPASASAQARDAYAPAFTYTNK